MSRRRTRQERTNCHRRKDEPRAHDVQAKRVDEIQGKNKNDREFSHCDHSGSHIPPRKGRQKEEAQAKKSCALNLLTMVFPHHEEGQCNHCDSQGNRDGRKRSTCRPIPPKDAEFTLRSPPPKVRTLDNGEDKSSEANRTEHGSINIDAGTPTLPPSIRHGKQCGDEYQRANRKVDQEDPRPRGPLSQRSTRKRTNCGSAGNNSTPDTECRRPISTTEYRIYR